MSLASAPGKVILFGEHAVVYGRPAIAVPVDQVRATAVVERGSEGQGIQICAPDLGVSHRLGDVLTPDQPAYPLQVTVQNMLRWLGRAAGQDLAVTVSSTVPIASGMGSGAAVATAVIRALAEFFDTPIDLPELSALVFETEIVHHGTPSGIDNSVITYNQPVYFVRGSPVEVLRVRRPILLAIADTGVPSPTRLAVANVRSAWEADRQRYEGWFDRIGAIAAMARRAMETGQVSTLGGLMNQNQELLRLIGVSSPELETLISAALRAGAIGAKLCGAGRGGNMIALVNDESASWVASRLEEAGAVRVMVTRLDQTPRRSAAPTE